MASSCEVFALAPSQVLPTLCGIMYMHYINTIEWLQHTLLSQENLYTITHTLTNVLPATVIHKCSCYKKLRIEKCISIFQEFRSSSLCQGQTGSRKEKTKGEGVTWRRDEMYLTPLRRMIVRNTRKKELDRPSVWYAVALPIGHAAARKVERREMNGLYIAHLMRHTGPIARCLPPADAEKIQTRVQDCYSIKKSRSTCTPSVTRTRMTGRRVQPDVHSSAQTLFVTVTDDDGEVIMNTSIQKQSHKTVA